MLYNIKNIEEKALETFFSVSISLGGGAVFAKKTLQPRQPQKASEVKTEHTKKTKRKKTKSYPQDAQVSALSE